MAATIKVPKNRKFKKVPMKDQLDIAWMGVITLPAARFFGELLWIEQDKKYKVGWAVAVFRSTFDEWPEFDSVEAIEPSEATKKWIAIRGKAHHCLKAHNARVEKQIQAWNEPWMQAELVGSA